MVSNLNSNILILNKKEDEYASIEHLLLEAKHYPVAISGKDHLWEYLEQNECHIILIDIDDYKNDAFQICRDLKHHTQFYSIPVLFIASDLNDQNITESLLSGVEDFIHKPWSKAMFLLRIKLVINRNKEIFKNNAFLNQMTEGSCVLEPIYNEQQQMVDSRILDYNYAFAKLLPFNKHDLTHKSWMELMPDTHKSWFSNIENTTKDPEKHSFEKYASLNQSWVSVNVYSIDNNTIGLILSDISEQKQLEESLQKSKDTYQLLFNNLNAAFSVQKIITDSDNKAIDYEFVEVNQITLDRFKLSSEQMIGHRIKTILPEITSKWIERFGQVALSGKPMRITDYSAPFNRYYDALLYCPMPGYCASIFNDVTEQVEAKTALKESEEKYRMIADNIGDWVWKSDLNLKFNYASPAVAKLRGISVAQVLSQSLEEAFPPESIIIAQEKIRQQLSLIKNKDSKGWDSVLMELQLYDINKKLVWIEVQARLLPNEQGVPHEIIGSAKDISAQKKAEIALIQSEEKYRSLFEHSKEPITLIKDRRYIECNQATLDAFGYKDKAQFLKFKPSEISPKYQPDGSISEEKVKEIENIVQEKGQHTLEWLHEDAKGNPLWFFVSIAHIKLKGDELFYTVYRDITKRKVAELALIKSEEKYRMIADNISDLVWKTNLKLQFTYVSPSIFHLRGYTQQEAIRHNLADILNKQSLEKVKKLFDDNLKLVKKGDPLGWGNVITDLQLKHKDGSLIWTQISARFIKSEKGEPKEIIGVTRDITKQKMAEIAYAETQQELIKTNDDKDKFISILAHDLIGSVGGSMQVIEMLEYKGLNWEKRETFINYLYENTKSSFDLLSNMVAWGKASLGKNMFNPKVINLFLLIQDIQKLYHVQLIQKNINLSIDIKAKQMVFADDHMLEAIYRNLLRNAIKFTPPGGRIQLKIKNRGKEFELSVEDNGVGMPKEKAEALFTLDHIDSEEGTQGEKGTGIGLQIAKEYVAQHRGEIWATSQLEKGTAVFFTLPSTLKQ